MTTPQLLTRIAALKVGESFVAPRNQKWLPQKCYRHAKKSGVKILSRYVKDGLFIVRFE